MLFTAVSGASDRLSFWFSRTYLFHLLTPQMRATAAAANAMQFIALRRSKRCAMQLRAPRGLLSSIIEPCQTVVVLKLNQLVGTTAVYKYRVQFLCIYGCGKIMIIQ